MRAFDGNRLVIAWGASLLAIPMLSIFGRSLQRWVSESAGGLLAWGIGVSTVALMLLGLAWLWRHQGGKALWHLLWAAPLFAWYPLTMPMVEERIHFIVFGIFGFLSLRVFGLARGLTIAVAASGLDEALQWSLPDRVGDWRDVGMNLLASTGGAAFAVVAGKR